MERSRDDALWRQFGAAIDTLDTALVACPAELWTGRVWPNPPPPWFPQHFAEFWHIAYHTLVWLDLYLAGVPEEEFAPRADLRPLASGCARSPDRRDDPRRRCAAPDPDRQCC